MTVISEKLEDIGGAPDNEVVRFVVEDIRLAADGASIITTKTVDCVPVVGQLTTPDLDPGPATVWIHGRGHKITVPVSPTSVKLWPLIDAGAPAPDASNAMFVRNGGGIRRAEAVTLAQFSALTTPDPETLYVIIEE